MTITAQAISHGRPLHSRPFFDLLTVRLVSYRHVWVNREDYVYECSWSDGTVTTGGTLPWDRMDGAIDEGIAS